MTRLALSVLILSFVAAADAYGQGQPSCESRLSALHEWVLDSKRGIDERYDRLWQDVFRNDGGEYPMAQRSLSSRFFSADEIQSRFESAHRKLSEVENVYERWKRTSEARLKEQNFAFLQETLKRLSQDTEFQLALALDFEVDIIMSDCKDLRSVLGLPCHKTFQRNEVVEAVKKAMQKTWDGSFSWEAPDVDGWKRLSAPTKLYEATRRAVSRVDDLLLRRNPAIEVESDPSDEKLTILLPVQRGLGFSSDPQWKGFLQRLTSVSEAFWKGTYKSPEGETLAIQLRIEENSDPRAVTVELNDAVVRGNGAEGGYDEERNALLFLTKTVGTQSIWENTILAHEVGHALGFPDHYHSYMKTDPCGLVKYWSRDDIMSAPHVRPRISAKDLELLYRAYGKAPSENDDALFEQTDRWLESLQPRKNPEKSEQ